MSASAQRWQCKLWCDFLPLRPIMISVAREAPRLRMLRPRRMALLASRNPGDQHIARFRARQRLGMAAHASEARVGAVIKFRMRHPAQCRQRRGDLWWLRARRCKDGCNTLRSRSPFHCASGPSSDVRGRQRSTHNGVALRTSFVPEKFLSHDHLLPHPFRRCNRARPRRQRLAGQVAGRVLPLA